MSHLNEQELPSVFAMVWERRRIAFTVAGVVVVAGIVYTLLVKPVWEAKATLIFPVRTPSILGVTSFDQTSLAASLTGGPTPLKVFGGMMESEHALNLVSKASGLPKRRLRDMRSFQDQQMESSLTISVRDQDPELAKKVVQLHLDALDEINRKVSRPLASSDADILKIKVDEQQKRVKDAEERLLAFQKTAVTAPNVASSGSGTDATVMPAPTQWSAVLAQLEIDFKRVDTMIRDRESRTNSIAKQGGRLPAAIAPVQKWRDKLTDMQYDLKVQELTLAPEAPELVKLRKAIALTQNQMKSELTKFAKATQQGLIDPNDTDGNKLPSMLTERVALEAQIAAVKKLAKVAPNEAMQLSRLTREVGTQGAILQQLQAQYELAQLQADRDPNRWEVLDEPEVDDKPVNKSLGKNGALSAFLGMVLGCFAALAWPKRKPVEVAADKPELQEAA